MKDVPVTRPPGPLWSDDITGAAVYVNGGYIEISLPYESCRLEPGEAVALVAAMSHAVAEAKDWAMRWDGKARAYRAAS
jgi:hypothetical protein